MNQNNCKNFVSLYFEKNKAYFTYMSFTNYKKYDFVSSFDKNLLQSVVKYNDYVENLNKMMCDLYYEMEEKKDILRNVLVESGAYKDHALTVKNFEKTIFRIFDDYLEVDINVVEKWKVIKDYYKKVKV